MVDTTRSDVDAVYAERGMSDSTADSLVSIANRLADNVFAGKLSTLAEVEGDEKDFKTYLAAHLWAIREGVPQSESQGGGSISYVTDPGNIEASLSQTPYGQVARSMLRDGASISVVKTRSR